MIRYRPTKRQCPDGSVAYRVMQGDTLYIVASKLNTTVEVLLELNPGINPFNIFAGSKICVPRTQQPSSTCPIGTSPYQIKMGDTLGRIAVKFNTTVEALLELNPEINPNALAIGQTICVTSSQPPDTPCPTLNSYVVRKGDTFYTISKAFEITVADLQQANPTVNPNNIYDGLTLCLPTIPSPFSIVVRIEQKILDLYQQGRFLKSYPIAVGKPSTPTPLGTFTIINKQVNPGGPFGTRWMGLSKPHYGIHGTNNPASIGTAASNGCIRMQNKDVNDLFNIVSTSTVVRIF